MTRTPIGAAIFCTLLAVAASASAEGAWVLWESTRPEYQPKRIEATITQAGCWWSAYRIAREHQVVGKPEKGWTWTVRGDRTGYTVGWQDSERWQIVEAQWSCWPDTVDPRERPKGGN